MESLTSKVPLFSGILFFEKSVANAGIHSGLAVGGKDWFNTNN
jgi:hypothetical protein